MMDDAQSWMVSKREWKERQKSSKNEQKIRKILPKVSESAEEKN